MAAPKENNDPIFRNAVRDLEEGNFSRLEPLFRSLASSSHASCQIIEWYDLGYFKNEPKALNEALACACFNGQTKVADFLMKRGVDALAGNATGMNGFHWAANRGHLETVKLLIERKVPMEVENMYGGTVLGCTVWSVVHEPRPNQIEVIETLLDAGANIEAAGYPTGNERVDEVLRLYLPEKMVRAQTWDPERYARNARFVAELGAPVLELLAPCAGERILDLGCGDGVLTAKLASMGCNVIGVDASAAQIDAARKLDLDVRVMNGEYLDFDNEFAAAFSNAALHWMRNPTKVIAEVRRALKPHGRFVAEFGGHGCVAKIRKALVEALNRRGVNGESASPWYFPTVEEYSHQLTCGGFVVNYIALIPRPTPLPGDVTGWLETFTESFTSTLPPAERPSYIAEVREALRPELCDSEGKWIADYVRLRFSAIKGS